MRLPFGFNLIRTKAAVDPMTAQNTSSLTGRGSWWPIVRESFTGAWQRNIEVSVDDALTYTTVFACVTQIASDIAKLWLDLVEEDAGGIRTKTENSAYSPLLRKPNHFQTPYEFIHSWMLSVLTRGNAYILKERDGASKVAHLYVLDPNRVQVLVAPDASIYYSLGTDYLSGITDSSLVVPQSEIIHDKVDPLYHQLCGISPLTACGLAVMQGKRIQTQSEAFFANHSQPGGLLTTANQIGPEAQKAIIENWEANHAGLDNAGRIAVLTGGLTYTPLTPITAREAQLIEQLNFTALEVCRAFRMAPYKVGVGPVPVHNKPQDLAIEYYEQTLQGHIERVEQVLTEGIGLLGSKYSVEFDEDALLRMDTLSLMNVVAEGVNRGIMTPNEARSRFDLKPVTGGDSPMMQQQVFSLEALSQRDEKDPFLTPTPGPAATPAASPTETATSAGDKQIKDVRGKAGTRLQGLLGIAA